MHESAEADAAMAGRRRWAGRFPALGRHPAAVMLAVFAAATLLGVIDASQVQYDRAVRGEPISWSHALIHGIPRWYAWALVAPVVPLIARRIHRMDLDTVRTLLLHVPAAVTLTLVQVGLFSATSTLMHGEPDAVAHLRPAFLKYIGLTFLGGLVTYAVIVGAWYALQIYRAYRERERAASRLELQTSELKSLLAEAQLQRLQAQLEPHFLFNSLHAISSLMLNGETTAAVRMTSRLSELLRRALRATERPEHSLEDELELVDDYLAIQRVRFEDRLAIERDVDPTTLDARVPSLILQPLVENAVRHGIEADPDACSIGIRTMRAADGIRIVIRNDGPALGSGRRDGSGVGLTNGRERLDRLYGDAASLVVRDAEGGGVEAELSLPYRPLPAAAAERSETRADPERTAWRT
jgi:hypothetical protein